MYRQVTTKVLLLAVKVSGVRKVLTPRMQTNGGKRLKSRSLFLHTKATMNIKYRIKKQAESRRHDSKRTIDLRHLNSLESNSMTQEVAINLRDICLTSGNLYSRVTAGTMGN